MVSLFTKIVIFWQVKKLGGIEIPVGISISEILSYKGFQ
jgi:hypothetical protein